MDRRILRTSVVILMLILMLLPAEMATGQLVTLPKPCQDLAFSTEEDFLTQGPEPSDGNPIISDGDLLSVYADPSGAVVGLICARNAQLLEAFALRWDLGLDAADVVSVEPALVAFSTELDAPAPVGAASPFSAGDLLATNGAVILNEALTAPWQVGYDIGLDAVHFTGDQKAITGFLVAAAEKQAPLGPADLRELFRAFPNVDIWFSTEGTRTTAVAAGFLDGDLLSARNGTIVSHRRICLTPRCLRGSRWTASTSAWMRSPRTGGASSSRSVSPRKSFYAAKSGSRTAMCYAMLTAS